MKLDMNKKYKYIKNIIIIFMIWLIIFLVDFYKVQKNELPIFCTNLFGSFTLQDGGTTVYFGLGYKVIDFNTYISIDDDIYWGNYKIDNKYICSWFTDYDTAIQNIKDDVIQKRYEMRNK